MIPDLANSIVDYEMLKEIGRGLQTPFKEEWFLQNCTVGESSKHPSLQQGECMLLCTESKSIARPETWIWRNSEPIK